MKTNVALDKERIIETIVILEKRIGDRFPNSGLHKLCKQFVVTAQQSKTHIEWISKPNIPMRSASIAVILIGIIAIVYSITFVEFNFENTTFTNVASVFEAIFNDLILLGAAIFFIISYESRLKRKRALKSLNELRALAHVIDMHQLTKDPNVIGEQKTNTAHSPKRNLSRLQLQRYLDYCSEMLALIGKVSALYAQSLPDEGVVTAVNEIEELSTGLSQKIWQKLMILNNDAQ